MKKSLRCLCCVALIALSSISVPSVGWGNGPAYLVKDLNPSPDPNLHSHVEALVDVGGLAYFVAHRWVRGAVMGSTSEPAHSLWRSDGTVEGTSLVRTFDIGGMDSISGLVAGETGVFLAIEYEQSPGRQELWWSDGTAAGTVCIYQVQADGGYIELIQSIGDRVFFSAYDESRRWFLWLSDATTMSTVPLREMEHLVRSSPSLVVNGTLFFTVSHDDDAETLWKSDGTTTGTVPLSPDLPWIGSMANLGETVLFAATDEVLGAELWRSDGSAKGTRLLKDINLGPPRSWPWGLVATEESVFFFADDGVHGNELWATDGTEGGTRLVKDFLAGPADSMDTWGESSVGVAVGSDLFFFAPASANIDVQELWRTDGSEAGTVPVTALNTGAHVVDFAQLASMGRQVFFTTVGLRSSDPDALWQTDGTPGNEVALGSFVIHADAVSILGVAGGQLFFSADDGIHGIEPWRTDGTVEGTRLVDDLYPGPGSSNPFAFTTLANQVFFHTSQGLLVTGLWRTDATETGTWLVRGTGSGTEADGWTGMGGGLASFDGNLYFSAATKTSGAELWRSDGTAGGMVLVKDIFPGARRSNLGQLIAVGDNLFFLAAPEPTSTPTWEWQLWKTDGTEIGTVPLTDPTSGSPFRETRGLTGFDGDLLFVTSNGVWRTDGSQAGTRLLKQTGDFPGLAVLPGKLYFRTGFYDPTLWTSDGTPEGTVPLGSFNEHAPPADFTMSRGSVYFTSGAYWPHSDPPRHLWKTDGTKEGTGVVPEVSSIKADRVSQLADVNGTLVFSALYSGSTEATNLGYELWRVRGDGRAELLKDINAGAGNSSPKVLAGLGNVLLLTADDGITGRELWRTDGTAEGTVQLRDIWPGASSSSPAHLITVGNYELFTADDGTTGRELWGTDGTASGTVRLQDINPGAGSSDPGPPMVANQHVFFAADDGQVGRELWALPVAALGAKCVGDCDADGRVTVEELIRGVNIALGLDTADSCSALDGNGDDVVSVDELVSAVNHALRGCDGEMTFMGEEIFTAEAPRRREIQARVIE
jgi:ELWxxDGT repeat protein